MLHNANYCVGLSPAGTINRWGSLPAGGPAGVEVPLIGPVRVPVGDQHHLTELVHQVSKGASGTILRLYLKRPGDSNSFVQVDETPLEDYGTRNIQWGTAIRFLESEQWKITAQQPTPGSLSVKVSGQAKKYDYRNTPPVSVQDAIYLAGDDFTLNAFLGAVRPNYGEDILAAHPGYSPSWFNGGISGMTVVNYFASQLAIDMAGPMQSFKYVGLCFGLADLLASNTPQQILNSYQNVLLKLISSGYIPVVATIPYYASLASQAAALNNDLASYSTRFGTPQGPDLYTWFSLNPSGVGAGTPVVPTAQGSVDTQRLWAQAMDFLYS
jgi:hypothetical protein